ncbi:hypothetical protein B0H12DRAFT_1239882 [Mycena haematopus]|nr:hypothetical protein B0H12DRAFT_1239882 [Mycena haematopus]
MPASLRLEHGLLNRVARNVTLPSSHGITPLVTAIPRADQAGSGTRKTQGGTVNEPQSMSLRSLYLGDRQVPSTAPVPCTTVVPQPNAVPSPIEGSLGMELILSVYSPPWSTPLPVTTIISEKDKAAKTLDALMADGEQPERIFLPLDDGQVMEGEVEGLLWATKTALAALHAMILVVSDSQAGLKGVLSTAPRSGQFRAIQNDLLCLALVDIPHFHIINLWTPAHFGTVCNELADNTAKTATSSQLLHRTRSAHDL